MSTYQELSDIEKIVLDRIKPKPNEYRKVEGIYKYVEKVISETLRKYGAKADITLQGSIAKDTWLSGEYDLDIFILFPSNWSKEMIREKAFKIIVEAAKKIGQYRISYAEHPYVKVFVNDVEVELVPAIKIDEQSKVKTAVDRTPFHTKYVLDNLDPEKRDHVRLLKKFMKNIGVYGAEVRVKGFSGYFTEVLVITYGGFREVLKAASKWKPPVYINTLKQEANEFRKTIAKLRKRYPDAVIYAPDPIDPERNIGASVSLRSLAIFSLASKCYLRKPSLDFFFEDTPSPNLNDLVEKVSKSNREVIFIIIPLTKILPPDILWGEINRVRDRVVKVLENYGFRIIYSSCWSNEKDKAVIMVELASTRLSKLKHYEGPPYYASEDRVLKFIRKHLLGGEAGPWINDNGVLEALSPRKYSNAVELLVDKIDEYLVAPDLRRKKPVITSIEGLYRLVRIDKDILKWVYDSIVRRRKWLKNCIA